MEAGDRKSAGEIDGVVKVEPFDYSAKNFLAAIRSISALCGEPGEESFEATELQRFSSMIIFIKEWRDFYYKPKIIDFSYETGAGEVKDAIKSITLPQFSSAIVPKIERLPDRTRFLSSNDFVLHSGGPVWALDWCPRIHEKSDKDLKCEYLAVAAHPPDSSYHNIGAPLVGRGVIQIWCLLSIDEKEALSWSRPSGRRRPRKVKAELADDFNPDGLSIVKRPRGRPRKRVLADDILCASNGEEGKHVKRPRGRPRKVPKNSLDDICQTGISTGKCRGRPKKKPRGRPRKETLSLTVLGGIEESPQCNNDPTQRSKESLSPLSIEFGGIIPNPSNLIEEESCVPRVREELTKDPIPSVNKSSKPGFETLQSKGELTLSLSEYIPAVSIEFGEAATAATDLNEEKSIPARFRGRPRKYPTPGLNMSVQSGVRSSNSNDDHAAGLNEHVSLVGVEVREGALVPFNSKEDSVAPKRRGRPQKNLTPNVGKFVQLSGLESLSQNESVSPLIIQSEGFASASANLSKDESAVPRRRGRPSKKLNSSVNYNVQVSAIESPQTIYDIGKCVSPSSIELGEPASVSTNLTEAEPVVPGSKGGPKRKPIQSLKESAQISDIESLQTNSDPTFNSNKCVSPVSIVSGELPRVSIKLNEKESLVPRSRGRPRKKLIPSVNKCVQNSGIESRPASNDASLLPHTSIEVAAVVPFSANLNEEKLSVPRSRGRPRKKPILTTNNRVLAFSVESEEVNLELPISALLDKEKSLAPRGRGSPQKKLDGAVSLTGQTDEECEMENCKGLDNGPPEVDSDSAACGQKRKIEEKARVVTGAVPSNPIFSIVSEGKSSATVLQKQDVHFQDVNCLSKEVSEKRSLNADISNSLIPEEFALPRVVLCLAHNGRVAWDVKWKPSDVDDSEGKHRMGYLAVLLGNGSLEVWEVPLPSMVMNLYAASCSESTDPRFLKLEPVFRCSKVKCGGRQSIPLTIEWSPSASQDLILGGCHDGTVALWKFTPQFSSQDTKPLLCFAADTAPIRAVAWAPEGSNADCANMVATAGHEGLRFWDLRDPYYPLWHINPQSAVLSVDWLKDPGCVILSLDDGTVRTLSIWRSACYAPFTGEPVSGGKNLGLHSMCCLPFAIWSIHVSRATGIAAYCSADGSAFWFQLTTRCVDKPRKRNEVPHILCGSITEDGQTLKLRTLMDCNSCASNELEETSKAILSGGSDKNEVNESNLLFPESKSSDQTKEKAALSQDREVKDDPLQNSGYGDEQKPRVEAFPPKIVALHRVRWNPNKGSERWLCYGGAAGIIRCQKVVLTSV